MSSKSARSGRSDDDDEALLALTGSPVVAINRAVALAEARGAVAGLEALDALATETSLTDYQPYWTARAELMARVGQIGAAGEAFERAIGLESDPSVRRHLARRRAAVGVVDSRSPRTTS